MLEFDLMKSPGLGAYLQGRKSSLDEGTSLANIANTQASTKNTLDRLYMDQEMHPLAMAQRQAQNRGLELGNQKSEFDLDTSQNVENQKRMMAFFDSLGRDGDVDKALAYSGAKNPEKIKQWIQGVPPDKLMKYAQDQVLRAPEHLRTLDVDRARGEREEATDTRRYNREMDKLRLQLASNLQIAEIKSRASIKAAEERAKASKYPNFQQRVALLISQLHDVKNTMAKSPEEMQAKLRAMTEIQDELDQLVRVDQEREILKAQGRQAGNPNLGAIPGANIPTNPMPRATGAPGVGGATPNAQPAPNQKQPTVSNWN